MGYDMYIVDDIGAADDYFRLNIFGMGNYLDYMETLGMVKFDTGYDREDSWPRVLAYVPGGHTEEEFVDVYQDMEDGEYTGNGEPDQALIDAALAYEKRQKSLLSDTDEHPGISYHKLCSNDGWLVTPIEIASALEAYYANAQFLIDATIPNDAREYWDKWIQYLQLAVSSGGFRVY